MGRLRKSGAILLLAVFVCYGITRITAHAAGIQPYWDNADRVETQLSIAGSTAKSSLIINGKPGTSKAETFVLNETFQEDGNTDKAETFGNLLSRLTEEDFMGVDGIISAHAEVIYDEKTEQYSMELSLTTDKEISEEQFELYKSALNKTFEDIVIIVNGVIVQ